ncbi:MAG: DNA polymerase III subunit alpha [Oscillospiraceae bacterium]|nr:DNA polymerase III subunit alpha [Oscillospiraceae bacterium]
MAAAEDFVHLHVHSEYSMIDGACRLEQLAAQAKALGQTAVAVTDHGNLYAAIMFYEAALAQGIRPIIGCEVYAAQRTRFDKEPRLDGKSYHLLLLCENNEGYQNLVRLVTLSNLEGFYKKPRVDLELLRKYHKGLICLSACIAGEIPRKLLEGSYDSAKEAALRYQEIFGKDNFFIEIQNHGIPEERQVLPQLLRLSRELGIPLAATNDVHYLTREDAVMQKTLLCIQTGKTMDEPHGMGFATNEFYLKTTQEMEALFPNLPEAITNTRKIADRCQVSFVFGERKLPHFVKEGVVDNTAYFRALCTKGMYMRYDNAPSDEVKKRLLHELRVIEEMGFVDYFLIVWDFIRYARTRGIPVGPGRGSGAGSLCAYCIGITSIDPIANKLLFERFLNPMRVSMPDIDIDFCIEGRQAVKDYVVERYGSERVCEIIAFDTMKARAAVRDVARVMNLPYALADKTAKLIDSKQSVAGSLAQNKELKALYDTDEQVRRLLDMAARVEGMPRHVTTHPAGVVIAGFPIGEYVPLQKNDETIVTQYAKNELEQLGLLKMDFLGLRNLTIIRDCERTVQKQEPDFSVDRIPLDDPEVYKLLSKGSTSGVFQLESNGIRQVLMRMNPQDMGDIIAVLALYRPGPMDSTPTYIHNRHHPESVQYLHPMLEGILKETYGCILYQEQVMEICRTLAGYSYGRADLVRSAMSKKKTSEMAKERKIFLYGSGEEDGCTGAVAHGVPLEIAEQIFDQMESFASYAFNKSHAAAYGLLAYQTAYLKCHYFTEYMAALMTSVISESPKLMSYLEECRAAGVQIMLPDVNTGEWSFSGSGSKMHFGLLAIRNLGKGLIEKMVRERQENGRFTGFVDFCRRMSAHGMNKRALEAMIQAGALDRLDCNRRQMLLCYENVMDAVSSGERVIEGQMSLFGDADVHAASDLTIPSAEEFPLVKLLQMEKEAAGMYLSGHPMDGLRHVRELLHCTSIGWITENKGRNVRDKQDVKLLCSVQSIKKHRTKGGEDMCFLTAEDADGSVDVIVFPRLYAISMQRLRQDAILCISGRISQKDDEVSVIAESIRAEEDFPLMFRQMQLCFKLSSSQISLLDRAAEVCRKFAGETEVIVYLTDQKRFVFPRSRMSAEISEQLYQELCRVIPKDSIGCIPAVGRRNGTA